MPTYNVHPHALDRPKAVRGVYIYNLVDCLHTCILKRDLPRARRAWAILIRCPDVNWREMWSWGLYLLTAAEMEAAGGWGQGGEGRQNEHGRQDAGDGEDSTGPAANPYAQPVQAQHSHSSTQREKGKEAFNFLRDIQLSSKEADKPGVLAEQVLHLIAVGRYRDALDELTTYLLDYPYTLSAPLHTYAGMVCFYLAQPASMRREPKPRKVKPGSQETKPLHGRDREGTADTDRTGTTEDSADRARRTREGSADSSATDSTADPAPAATDANYMRQARQWFMSALKLDPNEPVAQGFVRLIDKPLHASDDEMDLDESFDHSRDDIEDAKHAKLVDSDLEMASASPVARRAQLPMPDAGGYYSSDEGDDEGADEGAGEGTDREDGAENEHGPNDYDHEYGWQEGQTRLGRRRSARLSGIF